MAPSCRVRLRGGIERANRVGARRRMWTLRRSGLAPRRAPARAGAGHTRRCVIPIVMGANAGRGIAVAFSNIFRRAPAPCTASAHVARGAARARGTRELALPSPDRRRAARRESQQRGSVLYVVFFLCALAWRAHGGRAICPRHGPGPRSGPRQSLLAITQKLSRARYPMYGPGPALVRRTKFRGVGPEQF
jgi:hypothetical protein